MGTIWGSSSSVYDCTYGWGSCRAVSAYDILYLYVYTICTKNKTIADVRMVCTCLYVWYLSCMSTGLRLKRQDPRDFHRKNFATLPTKNGEEVFSRPGLSSQSTEVREPVKPGQQVCVRGWRISIKIRVDVPQARCAAGDRFRVKNPCKGRRRSSKQPGQTWPSSTSFALSYFLFCCVFLFFPWFLFSNPACFWILFSTIPVIQFSRSDCIGRRRLLLARHDHENHITVSTEVAQGHIASRRDKRWQAEWHTSKQTERPTDWPTEKQIERFVIRAQIWRA